MALKFAYSFDDGTCFDDSGGGSNLTTANGPTFVTGVHGLGLRCVAGSSQHATAADLAAFHFTTSWTLMCWTIIQADLTAELFSKQNQWWFSYDAGTNSVVHGFYFSGGGSTGGLTTGTNSVTLDVPVHVACRYDGTTTTMLLNGVQVNSDGGANSGKTMATSILSFNVGSWGGSSEFLSGIVDDIRGYDDWKTDAQVADLMNTPIHPPNLGIVTSTPMRF